MRKIELAHGAGGILMREFIEKEIKERFKNEELSKLLDSAILENKSKRIAFTTDSYVVSPIFFPGGNIGELAVNGTVNDLVAVGAFPEFISLSLIIEEGFSFEDLEKILDSIKYASEKARVKVVTGDTKVIEKGKGDGIFINTSGIGFIPDDVDFGYHRIEEKDKLIINGPIGLHGFSILVARENINVEGNLKSDTAPLIDLWKALYENGIEVHFMRDPTRGGVQGVLNEIAKESGYDIILFEENLPITDEVRGLSEILGIDPLLMANEGKMIFFVKESDAEKALKILREYELGKESKIIGEVYKKGGSLKLLTSLKVVRILDMPYADPLPRIC
ncbi:MAG: hydrogenase expression/formation protein HypE [Candidatus Hydrothermales bacterium]